jgi:putative NADH-flavin reductase
MKIAVIGAAGNIGKRIVREALDRHHEVTAVVRHPERLDPRDGKLSTTSIEDYAIVLVDELEKPQAMRRRITVAY